MLLDIPFRCCGAGIAGPQVLRPRGLALSPAAGLSSWSWPQTVLRVCPAPSERSPPPACSVCLRYLAQSAALPTVSVNEHCFLKVPSAHVREAAVLSPEAPSILCACSAHRLHRPIPCPFGCCLGGLGLQTLRGLGASLYWPRPTAPWKCTAPRVGTAEAPHSSDARPQSPPSPPHPTSSPWPRGAVLLPYCAR